MLPRHHERDEARARAISGADPRVRRFEPEADARTVLTAMRCRVTRPRTRRPSFPHRAARSAAMRIGTLALVGTLPWTARAQGSERPSSEVTATVPFPPTVVHLDTHVQLSYEVHVTNAGR